MKLEPRIEKLEASMAGQAGQYEDRADYRGHVMYAVGPDCAVMSIPDLDSWADEAGLWASRPAGTKFMRICGSKSAEVIDGVARPLQFRPIEMTPDARLGMEGILHGLGVDPS